MSDNTLAAIALIAFALMVHSCASCEKQDNLNNHEERMERLRYEHAQKEKHD